MNNLQKTINGLIDMLVDNDGYTHEEAQEVISVYLNTESFVKNFIMFCDNY